MLTRMRHKIGIWHNGRWDQSKSQINEMDSAIHNADNELFIGAAFFNDVPMTADTIKKVVMTL